jgi:phosphotransferase system enzyme I (PtsI)
MVKYKQLKRSGIMLKGIAVSQGYAITHILKIEDSTLNITPSLITDTKSELNVYKDAMETSIKQLTDLKTTYAHKFDEDMLSLFDAHIAIVNDVDIFSKVSHLINDKHFNFPYAMQTVSDEYITLFNQIDDDYLKSRAVDLKDVTHRIIANALNVPITDFAKINQPVILAIKELTPTQATQLDPTYIKGFISEVGSATSHSAIVAKLLNIPAVFGIKNLMQKINHNDFAILDGLEGKVLINPTTEIIAKYEKIIKTYRMKKDRLKPYYTKPLETKDGKHFPLLANLSSDRNLPYIQSFNVDGVGLFRTELLFLDHLTMPSYEEQLKVYTNILTSFKNQSVTIRTLDIGGDKPLPYVNHPIEENPALGLRGIRLSFKYLDMFKTQIKALLTASSHGHLKIMFPMISSVEEFMQAKTIVDDIKAELINEHVAVGSYQLGIMIEVPSAVLMAEQLAKVCDFFSIGTNDLIQYAFATDRLNENLNYLYQPLHPVILKLIKMTVDAAAKEKIDVSVCGEMASDPYAAILLFGLGVSTISISPASSLEIKALMSTYDANKLIELANHALQLDNQEQVLNYIKK